MSNDLLILPAASVTGRKRRKIRLFWQYSNISVCSLSFIYLTLFCKYYRSDNKCDAHKAS